MYWSIIVSANLFLIALVTLFPFSFVTRDDFSIATIVNSFLSPSNPLDDLIANILLFIPLGLGLAGILRRWVPNQIVSLVLIVTLSGSVSLSIEILQMFLPSRSSRLIDLLANSIGGGLGGFFLYLCQAYFLSRFSVLWRRGKLLITPRRLMIVGLFYSSFVIYLLITLGQTYNFSNWDSSFPLLIGNELTGDRPWRGEISELYLSDQSINQKNLSQIFTSTKLDSFPKSQWIASYQFDGNNSYFDQNGKLPNLVWQNMLSPPQSTTGISINQQHWLKTETPATHLIKSIQKTSEFSILATITTNDIQQGGPARIISISTDPYHRNFTMGQQGSNLIVRLRTSISGEGGNYPELVFPNIFVDLIPHRLLLSYHHHKLYLYVDDIKRVYAIKLSSEILFFRVLSLFGIRDFQIDPVSQWFLKSFFYGLISFPYWLIGVLSVQQMKVR